MIAKSDQPVLDVYKALLVYLFLAGDIGKTAVAMRTSPESISAAAKEGRWPTRLKAATSARRDDHPTDIQREADLVLYGLLAKQLRYYVEIALQHLQELELMALLKRRNGHGLWRVDFTPLKHFTAAAEAAHAAILWSSLDSEGRPSGDPPILNLLDAYRLLLSTLDLLPGLDIVQIVREQLNLH